MEYEWSSMMKTTPPASVKELNKRAITAYLYSKGPATKQMLVEFKSLEGIYENLNAVAEKWRKKLETHKEMAFLCRDIARLQTDLHIDGNLQQLRLVR